MRILELFPYYYPEQISSSHLDMDLEEALVNSGFDLVIITPVPTRGITEEVYKEYKNRRDETTRNGHVHVHRISMFREGKSPIIRAIRYILVNTVQYLRGRKVKSIDLIYAGSTPPTQGFLCSLVKKRLSKICGRNIPFIYNLQDVFPDSLVTTGMGSKNGLSYRIGNKMMDFTYKNADCIIAISDNIRATLLSRGVPEEKIKLIHNWIDTHRVKHIPRESNKIIEKYALELNQFYVIYAGNIGKAQDVETIVNAADFLKDEKGITFLVFGDGADKDSIQEMIQKKGLTNIRLLPLQSSELISDVYSLGDLCVVACKKGNGRTAFPSKSMTIMATATPILTSFNEDSELVKYVKQYEVGVYSEPGNAEMMADVIRNVLKDREQLRKQGENGRVLAENLFSKDNCLTKYIGTFEEVASSE